MNSRSMAKYVSGQYWPMRDAPEARECEKRQEECNNGDTDADVRYEAQDVTMFRLQTTNESARVNYKVQ